MKTTDPFKGQHEEQKLFSYNDYLNTNKYIFRIWKNLYLLLIILASMFVV